MNVGERTKEYKEALRDVADETRLSYNWSRIAERRHQQQRLPGRVVWVTAAALIVAGGIIGVTIRSEPSSPPTSKPVLTTFSEWTSVITVPLDAPSEKQLRLSDGSSMTLAPGATLEINESSTERFETTLTDGWVRFNVVPGQGRTWAVNTGLGRVIVLGTQFTVSRTSRAVKIAVHRGTVALYTPPYKRENTKISAGESLELHARDRALAQAPSPPSVENDIEASSDDSPTQADKPKTRPKARARSGARRRTMPASPMADLAGIGSSESINALLRAADDARKRNRPKEAAALLARILREFPDDPSAGLVALTLGRIRLDSLNRPHAAASAFKRAMTAKGLPSPLREQALARCAEAFKRAGDIDSARSMRDLYMKRFPSGVWSPWVERWAGIE